MTNVSEVFHPEVEEVFRGNGGNKTTGKEERKYKSREGAVKGLKVGILGISLGLMGETRVKDGCRGRLTKEGRKGMI